MSVFTVVCVLEGKKKKNINRDDARDREEEGKRQ